MCQIGSGGCGEVVEAVFEPPAWSVDGDDLAVVQEAVQDRGGEDFIGEDLAPLLKVLLLVMMTDPFSYRWEMSWKTRLAPARSSGR